jgi:hypothetical protein
MQGSKSQLPKYSLVLKWKFVTLPETKVFLALIFHICLIWKTRLLMPHNRFYTIVSMLPPL